MSALEQTPVCSWQIKSLGGSTSLRSALEWRQNKSIEWQAMSTSDVVPRSSASSLSRLGFQVDRGGSTPAASSGPSDSSSDSAGSSSGAATGVAGAAGTADVLALSEAEQWITLGASWL